MKGKEECKRTEKGGKERMREGREVRKERKGKEECKGGEREEVRKR